jgi:hypothetical protein
MKRIAVLAVGCGLLLGATGLVIATAERQEGPVFIPGGGPVSEDQIRQKLQADGWSDIAIIREGRYFETVASKNGQRAKIAVDAQTGRLRADDDDDDD